ncbi:MAG: hypothetical protein H7832_14425 [Magnetococcus sp. DMHC-6]
MEKKFRGVAQHRIDWEGEAIKAVILTLMDGQEVRINLESENSTLESAHSLSPKMVNWCVHIGVYLARMALLEQQEKQSEKQQGHQKSLQFEPRPDPKIIWWG